MSGYGLIKEVNSQCGWKPSAGSMYPALQFLSKKGMIKVKKEGRKKVYSLTKLGLKHFKEFDKEKNKMLDDFKKKSQSMSIFFGIKNIKPAITFLEKMKKGKIPFSDINNEITELKMAFFEVYNAGKVGRNKEKLKKIIRRTTKELKALK